MSIKDLNPPQTRRMFFMSVCHSLSRITEEVYFLGDPNVTAFLKALPLHRFCSTCTAMTCHLYVAPATYTWPKIYLRWWHVLPFTANTSANWNVVSRQIWRGFHTSVDIGHLSQVPPKQSAVCSRPTSRSRKLLRLAEDILRLASQLAAAYAYSLRLKSADINRLSKVTV